MLLLSDYIARLEEGVIRTSDLLSGELTDSERARLVASLDRFGAQLVAARVSLEQLGDVTVALHAGAREALGYAPRIEDPSLYWSEPRYSPYRRDR